VRGLNDDDENIRLLTSHSYLAHFHAFRRFLTPEYVMDMLLQDLEDWDSSNAKFAFNQVFYYEQAFHKSFRDQLEESFAVDDTLFAKESQNLFVDDSHVIKFYCQIFRRTIRSQPELRQQFSAQVFVSLREFDKFVVCFSELGLFLQPSTIAVGLRLLTLIKAILAASVDEENNLKNLLAHLGSSMELYKAHYLWQDCIKTLQSFLIPPASHKSIPTF
jgi:hypothetical protein